MTFQFAARVSVARTWDIRFRVAAIGAASAVTLALPSAGLLLVAAGVVVLLASASCRWSEGARVAVEFAPFLGFFVIVGTLADPSWVSLAFFAVQASRLLLLLLLGHFLALAATPADVAEGLRWFLRPLGRRRAWLAAQMAGWALASVPLVLDQARSLLDAAQLRGLSAARHPVRTLKLVTLGLLVRSVGRSSELAAALEARGFGTSVPAGGLKARWRDALGLLAVVVWLSLSWAIGSIFLP